MLFSDHVGTGFFFNSFFFLLPFASLLPSSFCVPFWFFKLPLLALLLLLFFHPNPHLPLRATVSQQSQTRWLQYFRCSRASRTRIFSKLIEKKYLSKGKVRTYLRTCRKVQVGYLPYSTYVRTLLIETVRKSTVHALRPAPLYRSLY